MAHSEAHESIAMDGFADRTVLSGFVIVEEEEAQDRGAPEELDIAVECHWTVCLFVCQRTLELHRYKVLLQQPLFSFFFPPQAATQLLLNSLRFACFFYLLLSFGRRALAVLQSSLYDTLEMLCSSGRMRL